MNDVSLSVSEGETLILLGSSGCGKSTTLKLINRLLEPDSGEIMYKDRPVGEWDREELRRSIGYVIQGVGLFPHWTIAENVGAVLRIRGAGQAERDRRVRDLLEMVDLPWDTFAGRFPEELSGGQNQRVGVARALAADPELLLMDEPFGALDGVNRERLQEELIGLKGKLGKTIVFVTHDLFEAMALADRIAVMHEGKIEQVGTTNELLNTPRTPFVRQLFGKPARQLALYNTSRE